MGFGTNLAQKRSSWSKMEKVNISIGNCIVKLVLVPNLKVNWELLTFSPSLQKKGISTLVLMWNSALREKLNFYFASTSKIFISGGGLGTRCKKFFRQLLSTSLLLITTICFTCGESLLNHMITSKYYEHGGRCQISV